MHIELTAEELQVMTLAFEAPKPFEVENVFDGKSFDYIRDKVTEICNRYIAAKVLGSAEFEDLMNRFFYPRIINSVFSHDVYVLSVMVSEFGICARYYDQKARKYRLWTIDSKEQMLTQLASGLKLPSIPAVNKQKKQFRGEEFAKLIERDFDSTNSIEKKAFLQCHNNDLKLVHESNELAYDIAIVTQFAVIESGILYLKTQSESDRFFVDTGITDAQGLLQTAFIEVRTK